MRVEHYSSGQKEKLRVAGDDGIPFFCHFQGTRKLMFPKNIPELPAIWMATGGNGSMPV